MILAGPQSNGAPFEWKPNAQCARAAQRVRSQRSCRQSSVQGVHRWRAPGCAARARDTPKHERKRYLHASGRTSPGACRSACRMLGTPLSVRRSRRPRRGGRQRNREGSACAGASHRERRSLRRRARRCARPARSSPHSPPRTLCRAGPWCSHGAVRARVGSAPALARPNWRGAQRAELRECEGTRIRAKHANAECHGQVRATRPTKHARPRRPGLPPRFATRRGRARARQRSAPTATRGPAPDGRP